MSKPALSALVLALGAAPALAPPPFKAPRNRVGQPGPSGERGTRPPAHGRPAPDAGEREAPPRTL